MQNRPEFIARVLLALIVVGLPSLVLGFQFVVRPQLDGPRTIDISASSPENGGFQPANITVNAGETVTLRFASNDVTHGIAIGPGLGIDLGHVDPGHVKEVTLSFTDPGTYTFYCNTWCSLDHWRMRGVVEVRDPANPNATPARQVDTVIEALAAEGVDIDAPHGESPPMNYMDAMSVLIESPSAQRGRQIAPSLDIPPELLEESWRRSHTPLQGVVLLLTRNPQTSTCSLADAVAYLWTINTLTQTRAGAELFYAKNCAACHGQTGDGDGIVSTLTAESPVAFSDSNYLFGRRGDVLYAKIRRGGMGTDMPNFGTLITPEETWALVDYLWTLGIEIEERTTE